MLKKAFIKETLEGRAGAGAHRSKWKAIPKSHRWLLHKQLGIPEDEVIPQDVLERAAKSKDPVLRRRAQFALNVRNVNRSRRRW